MKRALSGLVLLLAACSSDLGHGAQKEEIRDPLGFHTREGFRSLVPTAHIPSSLAERDQVQIWLSLPPTGEIDGQQQGGKLRLKFPPGTRADRVEYAGLGEHRRIVDIRGSTVTEDGQRYHVYRPSAAQPAAALFGASWPAGQSKAHGVATDYLVERIAAAPPVAEMEAQRRTAELDSFRGKNNCLPCHDANRPDNTRLREHGLVNRGTDVSGFFTPSTVFDDEVPLESYGRFDRSLDDPLLDIVCGDEVVEALEGRACPDPQEVPRARWNWERAWVADPARAEARCEQARWLAARMNARTQAAVAGVLENCRDV